MRFLAISLLASSFFAQDQKPEATYKTDVRVVNVLAAVHDKSGKIVQNLAKEDFLLTDDERPQTITYFTRQTDQPLTLGLLIDTSMSQQAVLGDERRASYKFFEKVLREDKDQAFVIHFDHEVELLRDLTSSRKELEAALGDIKTPELRRRDPNDPSPRRRAGGGTALYDSVLLASDELMKKQTGRKALIVLSDGVDNGSKVSLNTAIEAAQRSDTLVYTIRFADEKGYGNRPVSFGGPGRRGGMGGGRGGGRPGGYENRPDGKKVLERLAHDTGGGYFDVSKKESIDSIYARIEEELRNQYSLGFVPDKSGPEGEFRKLKLTVPKQKTLVVQTRDGYFYSAGKK